MHGLWPNRFPSVEKAEEAKKTFSNQELVNNIYGGRMGNDQPGDGWKYRGRGLVQLTGKANYKTYSNKGLLKGVDLVGNPELASDPDISVKIAAEYYANKGKGKDLTDIRVVSKSTGFAGDFETENAKRKEIADRYFAKGIPGSKTTPVVPSAAPTSPAPLIASGEQPSVKVTSVDASSKKTVVADAKPATTSATKDKVGTPRNPTPTPKPTGQA